MDNNSHFARSARLLLDQSGKYVACSVIDPPRALETARSFKPDLVIVDLIKSPELSKQIQIATGGMPISLGLDAVGGAAIVSIVETCRRLSIPIRDYLASVLPGLADFPINRVAELTPIAWATRNGLLKLSHDTP